MKNENLALFEKGKFAPINHGFMMEGTEILQKVEELQVKYKKEDTDENKNFQEFNLSEYEAKRAVESIDGEK